MAVTPRGEHPLDPPNGSVIEAPESSHHLLVDRRRCRAPHRVADDRVEVRARGSPGRVPQRMQSRDLRSSPGGGPAGSPHHRAGAPGGWPQDRPRRAWPPVPVVPRVPAYDHPLLDQALQRAPGRELGEAQGAADLRESHGPSLLDQEAMDCPPTPLRLHCHGGPPPAARAFRPCRRQLRHDFAILGKDRFSPAPEKVPEITAG